MKSDCRESRSAARRLALAVSLALLWTTLAAGGWRMLQRTEGHLTYTLDDPYIHMAVAKNLVQHGVWGVTPEEFTSSASSLLWVLLLSASYSLFGVHDVIPLALNLVAATALCLAAYALLRDLGLGPLVTLVSLVALLFWTPVHAIVFCGHEHTLHALLTVLYAAVVSKDLMAPRAGPGRPLLMASLAVLLVMTRYEGAFLVMVGCALFIWRRRPGRALLTALGGLLPVVTYGVISRSQGWFFLPNSILTKAAIPSLTSPEAILRALGFESLKRIGLHPHLLVLVAAVLVVLAIRLGRRSDLWSRANLLGLLFVATTLLHMQLAEVGSFYRYEAYLVSLAVLALAASASDLGDSRLPLPQLATRLPYLVVLSLALVITSFPLNWRAFRSFKELPRASRNIYEQQIQMAAFLKRYYQGEAVALNDIGAASFYADLRLVDVWGLANMEAARAVLQRRHTLEAISRLAQARGARLAVTYYDLEPPWQKVGTWGISDNLVCARPEVSFFALGDEEAQRLGSRLVEFSAELPERVRQLGPYTETAIRLDTGPVPRGP